MRPIGAPPPPPAPMPAPSEPPACAPGPAAAGAAFRLFGIPVRLNVSFLLVGAVFTYAPGRSVSTIVMLMGIVLVSILWHEIGHAVAFKWFGYEPEITLLGIMGLTYARTEREPSDGQSLIIASAGPAAGLLLAAVAQVLRDTLFAEAYRHPLDLVVLVNVVFNLFNLLPAYPLDGGRIVKSIMQMLSPGRGEKAAHAVSLVAAGAALVYSMNNDMQVAALMLLGIAGLNFSALRPIPRS